MDSIDKGNGISPGRRYRVTSSGEARVYERPSSSSKSLHRLQAGQVVVVAEVHVDEAGGSFARLNSPAGWLEMGRLAPAPPIPSVRLDRPTFMERHREEAPGDHSGLTFPVTLEALWKAGPEFLTRAFRSSGRLDDDNAVTEIVSLDRHVLKGASDNALLTVRYAKPDPGLHTDLFVKLPPDDVERKFHVAGMAYGEILIARRSSEGILPVPVADCYFADYCSSTTNYMLVTERIAFGQGGIEPAWKKGRDQEVPEIEAHYRVLAQSLARLVAAHKTGAMGYDLEEDFPFPRAKRDFPPIPDAAEKIDRLIDFISRIAPQLFPAEATTGQFLNGWRDDLFFGLEHKDTVIDYLHADVDYTGLCHPNLNVDNAWYWRDAAGNLQVGFLDLGGFGQMSIAQALSSMLMMPDPDRYLALEKCVIADFLRELERNGARPLDPDEVTLQYKASVYSTAISTIVLLIVDLLPGFSEADWATMEDRFDPRLQEDGLSAAVIWIHNVLLDWLDEVTPGEACRRIVAAAG